MFIIANIKCFISIKQFYFLIKKIKKHVYLQSLPCDRKCSPGNQKWSNLNTKLVLLLVSILLCKLGTHGHVFHHFFFSIKFLMHLLELIQLIQWMSINLPTNTMLRPANPRANQLSLPKKTKKKTFFFFLFFIVIALLLKFMVRYQIQKLQSNGFYINWFIQSISKKVSMWSGGNVISSDIIQNCFFLDEVEP